MARTGCLSPGGEASKASSSSPAAQEQSATSATAAAAKPAGATGAGKLAASGTRLTFGETANTHCKNGKMDSDDYKEATYETKVTKILAGSEADLAELKVLQSLPGRLRTTYYVFYESTLTSLSVPTTGLSDLNVNAQLKDGKDDFQTCKVGSTKASCSVLLAPAGDSVTTASYEDSGFSYENHGDNEYCDGHTRR